MNPVIDEILSTNGPVIADICVEKEVNCFPMIPSGSAHFEMILSKEDEKNKKVSQKGLSLV